MASSSSTILFLICLILAVDLIVAQKVSDVLKGHQQKIFDNFKSKYDKKYKDGSQELYRNLIVFKNANQIANHNLKKDKPYTLGMNEFSDLSQQEFVLTFAALRVPDQKVKEAAKMEQKKADLTENLCECDDLKMNKISEIEKNTGAIKIQLELNAKTKNMKKTAKLNELNKTVSQFQSKVSLLPTQDYEVTMTKIKQDVAKNSPNPTSNKTPSTPRPSTTSTTKANQGNGANNLKKNDPAITASTPALPSSLPSIDQSRVSSSAVNTSAGLQNLSNNATQALIIQQVLLSLGDSTITEVASPTVINVPANILGSTTTNTTNTTTSTTTTTATTTTTPNTTNTTDSVDWSNYTGGVRYQGACGSCYALAAVANVQTLLAIHALGFTLQLSAQQIIDCTNNTFTYGCDGGYLEGSYLFMKTNGVTTEHVYPYRSGPNGVVGSCRTLNGPFKITSFQNLPENDCEALKTELKKKPVSLGIASSTMQFYQSGVFNNCTNQVDHAVLLVGYDSTKGWKIKNTWGSSWGQAGYAWIQDGNTCGICSIPTSPTISSQPTN